MILRSKRRSRGPWGRTGPVVRGLSALSRAVAVAWRRSLQLRVVVLTLGMSLAVLLVLLLAAPLAAYVPLSALYVSGKIYQACADASASLGVFGHGYTYSGNPIAAAALATMQLEAGEVAQVEALLAPLVEGLDAPSADRSLLQGLLADARDLKRRRGSERASQRAERTGRGPQGP